MKNTRNNRRLAEIQDNFDGENSQSSSRERSHGDINEEYISQVSQEIEGRIAKKLSQEYSKRESRILGALAKLDDFLTKPVGSNGESTPKQKSTSVTGSSGDHFPNMSEREGYTLRGSENQFHIPDPEQVFHNCSFHIVHPVLHRAIFTEKRVHYVSGTMVLVAACLAAPLVMSDCENEYDYMFGYYLTVRTFLAMTNISCMTITYYKISKRLQKLHLKRVMSMNAAAASKMRDALASKGTNEMPESEANRASAGSIGETVEESDSGRPGSCRKKKQVKIQVKAPFRKQRTRGSSSAGCSTRNSQDNSCNKTISSNLEFYRNLPGYMRERTRRKQEKKMAVVMFCATIAFLILVCPQCVANIVEFCLKEEWTVTQRNCFFWTDAISVCLFNLHFSVNFFIYSIVNSSFRKRLRCIIRCQLRERDSDFEGKMVNVSGSGGSDEQKHRKASIAKNKSALAMVELRRSPAQPPPKRVEVEINNPPSTSSVFPEGLDKTRLDIAHNSKC